MRRLHVVRGERVERAHLVALEVRVREVRVGARRLKNAHEVVDMLLLVVLQLAHNDMPHGRLPVSDSDLGFFEMIRPYQILTWIGGKLRRKKFAVFFCV